MYQQSHQNHFIKHKILISNSFFDRLINLKKKFKVRDMISCVIIIEEIFLQYYKKNYF